MAIRRRPLTAKGRNPQNVVLSRDVPGHFLIGFFPDAATHRVVTRAAAPDGEHGVARRAIAYGVVRYIRVYTRQRI
ncbi:hypothetical protein PTE31013_02858 [Pandoraea terrigena]|uniref:Uncharacterized protein n=1 Tax=Pandoraea terrigena TaxID=2508292 RepID=A0A5E4VUD3_9BURK|nr:hypothetical protein PTE31013_02858 [Pandoraea terrigena]